MRAGRASARLLSQPLWCQMNIIKEILKNANETDKLKKKYYTLTSFVGLLAVFTGIGLVYVLGEPLAGVFGIDINENITDIPTIIITCIGFFIFFFLCIYIGMVSVTGIFSSYMCITGSFTKSEAVNYTFVGKYPANWFANAP